MQLHCRSRVRFEIQAQTSAWSRLARSSGQPYDTHDMEVFVLLQWNLYRC